LFKTGFPVLFRGTTKTKLKADDGREGIGFFKIFQRPPGGQRETPIDFQKLRLYHFSYGE